MTRRATWCQGTGYRRTGVQGTGYRRTFDQTSDLVSAPSTKVSQWRNPSARALFSSSARPMSSFAREGRWRSKASTSSMVTRDGWVRTSSPKAGSTPGSLWLKPRRVRAWQPRSARAAMRVPMGPSLLPLRLRSVSVWLFESASHTRCHSVGVICTCICTCICTRICACTCACTCPCIHTCHSVGMIVRRYMSMSMSMSIPATRWG